MTKPPKKRVSQQSLNNEYNANGWENRLASYTRIEIYNKPTPLFESGEPLGTHTIGYDYIDAEGKRVATVFRYERPNRSLGASGKPTPKGLLIDDVWCYV
jgi:hypothetical protein